MSLSRLVSGACAMALVAACTTGATPPVAARPSPTPVIQTLPTPTGTPISSPSPNPVPSPRPLVIPRPTTPFVRCDTADLEMRLIDRGAAAGSVAATIEVRNKSPHNCDLYGYAGLQLLDAHGRPLPTHAIWSTTSFFLSSPAIEAVVGLPAGTALIGTAALDPQHQPAPVPGHAYIPLSWSDVTDPCSKATQLRVTPPDAFTSLVISVVAPGSSAPIYVCSGGTINVNPTRVATRD